jgi:hypothetical protein
MNRLTPGRALTLAGAAAIAAALCGCGKTGELQRPSPIFGHPSASATPPAAQNGSQDPTRPVSTYDPRNDIDNPAPPRVDQVPGQGPDPTAPGPQGSLPNPYANPR